MMCRFSFDRQQLMTKTACLALTFVVMEMARSRFIIFHHILIFIYCNDLKDTKALVIFLSIFSVDSLFLLQEFWFFDLSIF